MFLSSVTALFLFGDFDSDGLQLSISAASSHHLHTISIIVIGAIGGHKTGEKITSSSATRDWLRITDTHGTASTYSTILHAVRDGNIWTTSEKQKLSSSSPFTRSLFSPFPQHARQPAYGCLTIPTLLRGLNLPHHCTFCPSATSSHNRTAWSTADFPLYLQERTLALCTSVLRLP